jgi:putative aldouronate transport system permease protein
MLRLSRSDRLAVGLSYVILILALILVVLPLLNLLAISMSTETEVLAGKVTFWPRGFHLNAYSYVIFSKRFLSSFGNTVFLTIVGTTTSIFSTCLAAFSLSRKKLPGKRIIMLFFIFSMLFNGGMIPTYLLVMKLKLLNSFFSIIFVSAVSIYNLLIVKNYFETIPLEIEESAQIDGARPVVVFCQIMLPLAVPVLATISLFYAVGYWNEYFNAKLYLTKQSKLLLQPYLQAVIFEASDPTGVFQLDTTKIKLVGAQTIINATVVSAMLPIVILYPFLQKYFVSGIVLGSVKG